MSKSGFIYAAWALIAFFAVSGAKLVHALGAQTFPSISSTSSSCGEKTQMSDVIEAARSGLHKGLSCLAQLNTPTTKRHGAQIRALRSVQLTCDVTSEDNLRRILAQGHQEELGGRVRFNSQWVDEQKFGEIEQTFFHEIFHVIGNVHFSGIEYAYSCEECCFKYRGDRNSLACRICSQDFDQKGESLDYSELLNQFMAERGSPNQAYTRVLTLIAKNPARAWELMPQLENALFNLQTMSLAISLRSVGLKKSLPVHWTNDSPAAKNSRRVFSFYERDPYLVRMLEDFYASFMIANHKWTTLLEPVPQMSDDPIRMEWERFRRALFTSGLSYQYTDVGLPEIPLLNQIQPNWADPHGLGGALPHLLKFNLGDLPPPPPAQP